MKNPRMQIRGLLLSLCVQKLRISPAPVNAGLGRKGLQDGFVLDES